MKGKRKVKEEIELLTEIRDLLKKIEVNTQKTLKDLF